MSDQRSQKPDEFNSRYGVYLDYLCAAVAGALLTATLFMLSAPLPACK